MGVPWWVWPQSVVWVLAHWYLWRRLVRDTTWRGGWPRRIGTVVLVVLAPVVPGALVGMHILSPTGGRWITWPGFVWFGVLLFLLSVLVLTEPVRAGFAIMRRARRRREKRGDSHRPAERAEAAEGRRLFMARAVAIGAATVAAGMVGYGVPAAFRTPVLERITVRLRGLPDAATGFRIALVADTHIGPFLGKADLQRVVDIVNGAGPDLVVIAGDLIDGTVADLRSTVTPLLDLRSRHGTYFCTGNHEYLFDADAWVEQLARMGIRTLRNERLALPHFDLAGVNDYSGSQVGDPPDYARALGNRDPERPVVLMAHQPVQVREAERFDVDLQLSGHTHGGQFFPASALAAIRNPMLAGYYRFGATQLYVTRGTGFWGPAIRIGATPEVTLIRLTPDG